MKKLLWMVAAITLSSTVSMCQQGKKSPHETVSSENVSISYGRPYKKDRVIFGTLVKFDEVWRTGADDATEITFKKDGTFAGKPVKAGTYTLFTIPGASEWTVILNSTLKQWGAYGYEKTKTANVLEAKVKVSAVKQVVEQLTITPSANAVTIVWDTTEVVIPIAF